MIWKIFFIIATILLLLIQIFGFNSNYTDISMWDDCMSIAMIGCIIFVLGIFYSLGWKRQLFSKTSIIVFAVIFIINMIMFPVLSTIQAYPIIYSQTQNSTLSLTAGIVSSLIMTCIINLFLIPFYIGLYKYKKANDLTLVAKSYWELFSLYLINVLFAAIIFSLTKYAHFISYNCIDYFVILSFIYEIIFIIGFVWNIKIFNQMFWKITAVPYVLLTFIVPFGSSDTLKQDFHLDLVFGSPILIFLTIITTFIFFYMLYVYAYKMDFKNTQ